MKKSKQIKINDEWEDFFKNNFPQNVKMPPLQRVILKRAFFGGFGQALLAMGKINAMDDKDIGEAIESLDREIKIFWSKQLDYKATPGLN
jgi:hypothetical protein